MNSFGAQKKGRQTNEIWEENRKEVREVQGVQLENIFPISPWSSPTIDVFRYLLKYFHRFTEKL